MKLVLSIPDEDLWFLECLKELVAKKKEVGFNSTLAFEFIRLAKCGLSNNMAGAPIDRRILGVDPKKST